MAPLVERSAPVRSAMALRWALCGPNRAFANAGSSKERVSTKAVGDAVFCIDSEGGGAAEGRFVGSAANRGSAVERRPCPETPLSHPWRPARKVGLNLSHLPRSVYGSLFRLLLQRRVAVSNPRSGGAEEAGRAERFAAA